jgi:hypothetical protein
MFGKPEWFRDKKVGWGLRPITWQGWLYTTTWGAAVAGPFAVLLARPDPTIAMDYRLLSAGLWLVVSMSGLIWDVWQIKRARNAPPVAAKKEPVLYIGDDDARSVSTKNLDLQLRR